MRSQAELGNELNEQAENLSERDTGTIKNVILMLRYLLTESTPYSSAPGDRWHSFLKTSCVAAILAKVRPLVVPN